MFRAPVYFFYRVFRPFGQVHFPFGGADSMSNVKVTDKRGGKYQATIEFTYGECERLPFNVLRRINARIEPIPEGGIKAIADFNIRIRKESVSFLEMLDLFGEEGSFVHGSAADPEALARTAPPEEADDGLELEGTLNSK